MHIVMERKGLVLDMNLDEVKDKAYLEQLKKDGFKEVKEETAFNKIAEASVGSFHKEKK